MGKFILPRNIKVAIFCLFLTAFFLQGCFSAGKPGYEIHYFLLDYPAPVLETLPRLDSTVRFNRFTITSAYNTQNMIYRADNYSIDSFSYNRWAVNPADMVADMLLRDMQTSKFFRAVFSRYSAEQTNYLIEGSVGEFFLRLEPNRKFAVLSLEITFKDARRKEANKRVVYQKKYRHEEVLSEQTPRGYTQAMSQALSKISAQIIIDVRQAIKSSTK